MVFILLCLGERREMRHTPIAMTALCGTLVLAIGPVCLLDKDPPDLPTITPCASAARPVFILVLGRA